MKNWKSYGQFQITTLTIQKTACHLIPKDSVSYETFMPPIADQAAQPWEAVFAMPARDPIWPDSPSLSRP
jgi:hypothetical protein